MLRRSSTLNPRWIIPVVALAALLPTRDAFAAVDPEVAVMIDTVWVVLAGILVFFMNAASGCSRPESPPNSAASS